MIVRFGNMVKFTVSEKVIDARAGTTIETAVRESGFLPDAYIFLVNGRPMPMDTPMEDTMNIKAIKVASGG